MLKFYKIKIFILYLFLANLVSNTFSLRCYACNSNLNEGCREYDYSLLTQDFTKDCDLSQKACSKFVLRRDGKTTIIRDCANEKPCQSDSCTLYESVLNTYTNAIYYCNKNLCNNSPSLRIKFSLILLIILINILTF